MSLENAQCTMIHEGNGRKEPGIPGKEGASAKKLRLKISLAKLE